MRALLDVDAEEAAAEVQRTLAPMDTAPLPEIPDRAAAPVPDFAPRVESISNRHFISGSWLPALVLVVAVMLGCSLVVWVVAAAASRGNGGGAGATKAYGGPTVGSGGELRASAGGRSCGAGQAESVPTPQQPPAAAAGNPQEAKPAKPRRMPRVPTIKRKTRRQRPRSRPLAGNGCAEDLGRSGLGFSAHRRQVLVFRDARTESDAHGGR